MKLYVDELPKSCSACPYCYHEMQHIYCCVIRNKFMEFFNDDYLKRDKECPLLSLSDYTKQVRKEVCEEIRELVKDNTGIVFGNFNHAKYKHDEVEVCRVDIINEFLDQGQSKDS